MAQADHRSPEQIRAEIEVERAQLDARLTELAVDAKRSGRRAGKALAALGGVVLLARLRSRRRGS